MFYEEIKEDIFYIFCLLHSRICRILYNSDFILIATSLRINVIVVIGVVVMGIHCSCTLQPLYNTVCYNMVLDITWFKDGSQKCIDYIEK